ncbi:MAG: class I SAM-dependent methyltransferase [Syntrophaceae bacterium]|nr:class I SAM-dependent methyltransferase [Syntrophaceae bacterium]
MTRARLQRGACGALAGQTPMSSKAAKDPYQIEYEVEEFHWWFTVRRKLLKTLLSDILLSPGVLALDIGCGTGSNLRVFTSTGLNVVGLDRSIRALRFSQKKFKFPLVNGDLNGLPFKNQSVGLIIAADILEHLDNDLIGVQELHRVLKKNGVLILTVPAFERLWGTQDVVTAHKRRYTKKEILMKLRRVGFKVLRASYFNFFLFLPIFLARRIIHLLGLTIQSENEINSPLFNFFLKTVFSLELPLLKSFSLPFGVSIFCVVRK